MLSLLALLLMSSDAGGSAPGSASTAEDSGCRVAITPENAQLVYESFKGATAGDGCKLEGVTTAQFELVTRWRRASGARVAVRVFPGPCAEQRGKDALRLQWKGDEPLRAACPATHTRVTELLASHGFGAVSFVDARGPRQVAPASGRWDHRAAAETATRYQRAAWRLHEALAPPRQLVAFGVGLLAAGLALLGVRRWRRSWWNASRIGAWVAVATAVGGAAAFVVVVADASGKSCLSPMDLSWLVSARTEHLELIKLRPAFLIELRLLFPLAGLDAGNWAWLSLALHAGNSVLLFVLARTLQLPTPWAAVAALLSFGCPAVAGAFSAEYWLELWLTSAYLIVAIAYLRRAAAPSRRSWGIWLLLEVSAVFWGLGNKESFVVYLGLPLALELVGATEREAKPLRQRMRAIARRLSPHLILLPLVLVHALPRILSSTTHPMPRRYDPGSLFEQVTGLFGMVGGGLGSAALPATWVGALLTAGLVLAAAWRGPQATARRFGAVFALTATLPMAPLAGRLLPGYLVQPWPGLVLCLVATAAASRSGLAHAAVVAWTMALAGSNVPRDLQQDCLIPRSVAAQASSVDDATCRETQPHWQVEAAWVRAIDAGLRRKQIHAGAQPLERSVSDLWREYEKLTTRNVDFERCATNAFVVLRQLLQVRCSHPRGQVVLAEPPAPPAR